MGGQPMSFLQDRYGRAPAVAWAFSPMLVMRQEYFIHSCYLVSAAANKLYLSFQSAGMGETPMPRPDADRLRSLVRTGYGPTPRVQGFTGGPPVVRGGR